MVENRLASPEQQQNYLSRRDMLKLLALFLLGASVPAAALSVDRLVLPAKKLIDDWKKTEVDSATFLEQNKAWLQRASVGCSLSPEQLVNLFGQEASPAEVVTFLRQQLGITEVRLGIRWNQSVVDGSMTTVDLQRYRPWIAELKKQGMKICLNVGPIKVLRWPEDHVPQAVFDHLAKSDQVPQERALISADDEIAQIGFEYLENLCATIRAEFGEDIATAFQPDNEPFIHFGKHKWIMNYDYIYKAVSIIHKHFPQAEILLNSPIVKESNSLLKYSTAIRQTFDVCDELIKVFPDLKMILGSDFYYKTPFGFEIDGVKTDALIATEVYEGRGYLGKLQNIAAASGIKTEVSEAQLEPWGDFTSPGNSLRDLMFMLLRAKSFIAAGHPEQQVVDQLKSVVRLWGVEGLFHHYRNGTMTSEHKKMFELIKMINEL